MTTRQLSLLTILMLSGLAAAQAQVAREPQPGDLRIIQIRPTLEKAPNFPGKPSPSPGVLRDWLQIEVQFETKPEWVDDLKLVYYALMGSDKEFKLFKAEITHSHVSKGAQHYSAVFMHPNALRRFNDGRMPKLVGVQLLYRDRPFHEASQPARKDRWWEQLTPHPEGLLTPMQTPWGVVSSERYEPIHQSSRPQ